MRPLPRLSIAVLSLFVAGAGLLAGQLEQVDLKNGDRITAAVIRSDAKGLTVTSAALGEVTVPWDAIAGIVSDKTLFVVTPDKRTISGAVTTEGGDLVVAAAQESVHVPLASTPIIRSVAEQTAYERAQHPGLLEGIRGTATVGLTLARGNSEATNLAVGFTTVRTTPNDRFSLYYTSIYASDATGTTANDIRGGARYDRNFRAQRFGLVSADYEHNPLQFLSLRQIYTLGLGVHVIGSDPTTLDLFGGLNYTREVYTPTPTNDIAGATLGEDWRHKFGANGALSEQLIVYPELSNLGEFRVAFDTRVLVKLKNWLNWQATVSDRYVSSPPGTTRKNDLILTTGLSIAFAH